MFRFLALLSASVVSAVVVMPRPPGPTAPPSLGRRQIPQEPFNNVGDPSSYHPGIMIHSEVLSVEGASTVWTASDTSNVIQTVTKTESNGAVVTSTEKVEAALNLVTVAGNGQEIGDWNAIFTPEAAKRIKNAFSAVCTLPGTETKRSGSLQIRTPSCREFAQANPNFRDRLWEPIRAVIFEMFRINVSADQGAAIVGTIIASAIVVDAAKSIQAGTDWNLDLSWLVPKKKVDQASQELEESETKCGQQKPVCAFESCKGESTGKCTVGNSNGCQCMPQVYINYEQSSGRSLEALKEMYQMLQEMMKDDTGGVWCTYLYTKDKIPSKVCQCGPQSEIVYYELASGGDPCPWTQDNHPKVPVVFQDPNPPKTPKCGFRYDLQLHQWMDGDKFNTSFTVFCNGVQTAGPESIDKTVPNPDHMPLWVEVDNPVNIESTDILIGYSFGKVKKAAFSTGKTSLKSNVKDCPEKAQGSECFQRGEFLWVPENPNNDCDTASITNWSKIGAGYQRDVMCTFEPDPKVLWA